MANKTNVIGDVFGQMAQGATGGMGVDSLPKYLLGMAVIFVLGFFALLLLRKFHISGEKYGDD